MQDLNVSFDTYAGEVQAVRGVSWHLNFKETVAIVGESGCGKTVSIQTAMGLLAKPAGRHQARAHPVPRRRHRYGQPGAHPSDPGQRDVHDLSGPADLPQPHHDGGRPDRWKAYLQHHRKHPTARSDGKVLEIMKLVSFPAPERNMRAYPYQLSGGMRQRIMVAMALICGPAVLIRRRADHGAGRDHTGADHGE